MAGLAQSLKSRIAPAGLPSSSAPNLHLQKVLIDTGAVQIFSSYVAESVKQTNRMSLLRSCLLGQQEKMTEALHDLKVNQSLPMPFYKWEYVIVFDNPDFTDVKKKKGVTKTNVETQFNECFNGESGGSKREQDINKHFEQKAFMDAFSQLPESDYIPPKWEYIKFQAEEQRKAYNKGGLLSKTETNTWEMHGTAPKDYQTLIRNFIQTKLALHVGLKTRLLLSSNGKFIFLMLAADEVDLQNEAERVNYPLQMELGATDMDSLEPCDENLRPLGRLKKEGFEAIQKEIEDLKAGLYKEVKGVESDSYQRTR